MIEAAAQDVRLTGLIDGLLMFAAADVSAFEEALENLFSHLSRERASRCIWSETFEQWIGKDLEPSFADALQPLVLNNSKARLRALAQPGEASGEA